MTNCALILIASLPTIWLIVGCLLIVITLIAVVLFLVKAREVAVLKKEVMEARETMRMMRYEELSLSRMLHTADKSAPYNEALDEAMDEPMDEPTEETTDEPTPVIIEEEPTEEITDEEPAEEHAEGPAVEEAAEETEEEVVEEAEEEECAEEPIAEEPIEETIDEPIEEEAIEETIEETVEEAIEEAPAEEPTEEMTAEEPTEEITDEELAEEYEEIPVPIPTGKQPINERRPAIPNDLFSAWFEENELAEPEAPSPSVEAVEELAPQPVAAPAPVHEEMVASDDIAAPAQAAEPLPAEEPEEVAEEAEAQPVAEPVQAPEAAAPAVALSKEDERFCRKLERIVETRMRNPNLNIDVIASQFGIGRTNFYRKVRELMGMSPNDYLRKCRMDRAAELLRTTDLPVSDVCVQIGVPDAQYFSRVFKTFYGVTPTAYREQA